MTASLGPVMLDVEGTTLNDQDRTLLADPFVGGLIIFARNFENRQQLKSLVQEIRAVRPDIIIAVDQEGGRVQRFKGDGFTRLPPMQSLRAAYRDNPVDTLHLAQNMGWLLAAEVLACDVDISFAPVLDVDYDFSSIIGDRAFSDQPDEVVALAGALMTGMHQAGMATTGKHFPGHGAVIEDSHLTLPVDTRSWDEINERDLLPFSKLKAQLDAVMPAHIVFEQVDAAPVGFSSYWLKTILRTKLGFDGVIFSDDLTMAGAAEQGSYPERAAAALAAGCDMVLVCNNREGAIEVLNSLAGYGYSEDSARRLQSMRARKVWQWQAVREDEQWDIASQQVAKLLA